MARISTYAVDSTIAPNDKLIGTDAEDSDLTKNYRVSDLSAYIGTQLRLETLTLTNKSTANQEPSGLDTILQVEFGGAVGSATDPVMLDAAGNITFNTAGQYWINVFANFERQGSSGGVTATGFRGLLNNTAIANHTVAMDIDQTGIMIPYEHTFPVNAQAGDILKFEIVRDSSGVDAGGLYTHTMASSFDNIPSSGITVHRQLT